jgi:hypothetical protein
MSLSTAIEAIADMSTRPKSMNAAILTWVTCTPWRSPIPSLEVKAEAQANEADMEKVEHLLKTKQASNVLKQINSKTHSMDLEVEEEIQHYMSPSTDLEEMEEEIQHYMTSSKRASLLQSGLIIFYAPQQ